MLDTTSSSNSVNFYRNTFYDECNLQLVEASKRGDLSFIKRHLINQDLRHPHLYPDEFVENRYGMQVLFSIIQSLKKKFHILDIGCGNVELLKLLSQAGHCVSGVDASPIRVNNHSDLIELTVGFAENVPFHSERFDIILALECLEHVADLDRTLSEMLRLLKPGGLLFCQVPLGNSADDPTHLRHFDPLLLSKVCRLKGFEVVAIETIPYLVNEPANNIFLIGSKPDINPINQYANMAKYYFLRSEHRKMLSHCGIELTNICNLSCPTCSTLKSRAPRGFADERTVRLAMEYAEPGQVFSFYRSGEPLLHRDVIKYVRMASRYGLQPQISTNGLLLSERVLYSLLEAGITMLQITLHTEESCFAYMTAARFIKEINANYNNITFHGNLLSSNHKAISWLKSLGAKSDDLIYVRSIGTHNCAGNVLCTKVEYSEDVISRRMTTCWHLSNNKCNIRWDGTIVSCRFDSENDNVLGTIDNYLNLKHTASSYSLCKYCDANWANGEMI
jgi:SAM-dependent methyltransferase